MNAGDFVEELEKIKILKEEGIINEDEYTKQVEKIKKEYTKQNNIYVKNSVNNSQSQVGSLLALIIIVIVGMCLVSNGTFNSIIEVGKDFIDTFDESTQINSGYNNGKSNSNSYNANTYGTSSTEKIPNEKESKATYIASCKSYDSKYEDMQRNPNSYKGLKMKFIGDVEQRWSKNGSTCAFTLSACTSGNAHIGMIYCTIDDNVLNGGNLLQYDRIIVYGEFKGLTDNLYNIYGYANYPSLDIKYIEFSQR